MSKSIIIDDNKESSQFYGLAPEQATFWLEKYEYIFQRPIRQWWVDYLAREMRKGRFEPTAILMFAINKEDGKRYNLNGRHTMQAIIKSQLPQKVIVISYVRDNLMQIRKLYTTIDKNLKRTIKDDILALNLPEINGLNVSDLIRIQSALKFITSRFNHSQMSRKFGYNDQDIINLIPQWIEYYTNYKKAISKSNLILTNAALVSMGIITFKFDSINATNFWTNIALGTSNPKSAERVFREFYLQLDKKRSSDIFKSIMVAWNSFIKSQKCSEVNLKNPPSIYEIYNTELNNNIEEFIKNYFAIK